MRQSKNIYLGQRSYISYLRSFLYPGFLLTHTTFGKDPVLNDNIYILVESFIQTTTKAYAEAIDAIIEG